MFILLRQWSVDWYHEVLQSKSVVDYFMALVFLALVMFNTYVSVVLVWDFTPVIIRVTHAPCLYIFLATPFIACSIVGYTIIYTGLAAAVAVSLATIPTKILYHFMGWENGEFDDIWWSGMHFVAKAGWSIAGFLYALWVFVSWICRPIAFVCASPCSSLYTLCRRAVAAPAMHTTARDSLCVPADRPLRTGGRLDPHNTLDTPSPSSSPDIELGQINRRVTSGSSTVRQDVPVGSPGWRKPSGSPQGTKQD